jgi:Fe-S oxidoreductase
MTLASSPASHNGHALAAVEALAEQNVYACYQCGKCMAACPFALQPQHVMRLLQLGQVDRATSHPTTWNCASCLTCVSACPKGVSPARFQRTLRSLDGHAHPHRLRTAVFANIHRLSRLGSALAPLSNWALDVPGAKLLAHHVLGIHRARSLPPFARATFPDWFRRRAPRGDGRRGTVVLFHDTFMDFNYPRTGIAATELLEAAGLRVELADMVCCGRPMISKGLQAQAAEHAKINVTRLYEQARRSAYIVGCEPSCLLTLREEYPELVGPELRAQARVVAQQALLIDEYLGMLNAQGELGLTFRRPEENGRAVTFHAHCHQRALAAPARSVELLELAGYRAEMTDAACCGMAGAYGYEVEHYEASRAAGERLLFPLVRARTEAEVAVMGTSCRQQIEHFTGRPARHVVELLREALAET